MSAGPQMKPRTRSAGHLVPVVLLCATAVSTFLIGTMQEASGAASLLDGVLHFARNPASLLRPASYAAAIMGVLLAHEMGHYIAARRRGVDQSLPYFIPFPSLLGTLGAVIVMRSTPRTRSQLFDVAVSGPLAGLLVAVPLAIYGLIHSTPIDPELAQRASGTLWLGNSLLFLALEHVFSPAGDMIILHPVGFAAWAGLLVTALNLIPASQLDGGHIMYAVFGARAHRLVAIFVIASLFGLGWRYSFQVDRFLPDGMIWLLWGGLLFAFGRRHPPVMEERQPLDKKRRLLAALMLLVFVLTFVPLPVRLL